MVHACQPGMGRVRQGIENSLTLAMATKQDPVLNHVKTKHINKKARGEKTRQTETPGKGSPLKSPSFLPMSPFPQGP